MGKLRSSEPTVTGLGTWSFALAIWALSLLAPPGAEAVAQGNNPFGCCQIGDGCASPAREDPCINQGGDFVPGGVCGDDGRCVSPPVSPEAPDRRGCCRSSDWCDAPVDEKACLALGDHYFIADATCTASNRCRTADQLLGSARIGVTLAGHSIPPFTIPGEVTLVRDEPGPGASPDQIPAEIVSMELAGTSSTLGPVTVTERVDRGSTGQLELGPGGVSLFDLFMELDVPGEGIHATTPDPVRLQAEGVRSFPPAGVTLSSSGSVPLVQDGSVVGTIDEISLSFGEDRNPPGDCRLGPVPAATLLVPYFEVDVDDPGGRNTLVAVTNVTNRFTLVRVILWTDLAVPTLTFYVFLSPGDVQTISVRDLFAGVLPDTSAVLADPELPVVDFEPCQASDLSRTLTAMERASLRADHTGAANPITGVCAGIDRGDSVARGYITLDTVNRCAPAPTVATHAAPESIADRFNLGHGNSLMGDYLYVDSAEDFAQSENAVHRPYAPLSVEPGDATFYGRYVGFDASDGRLPLGSRYQVRFLQGGPFDGASRLVIWRDNLSDASTPVECGSMPSWFPLGEREVVLFDEEENVVVVDGLASVCPGAGGVSFACPLEGAPFNFGFIDLDLAHGDGSPAQAAVSVVFRALGRFSVSHQATPLDDGCGVRPLEQATPLVP